MTTQARNQGRQPRRRGGDASEQQPAVANGAAAPAYPPRVLTKLRDEIGPQLMGEFGYTSPMQVPRFSKIVLNIGMGEALQNARAMEKRHPRPYAHFGAAPRHHAGQEVRRRVQDTRGHAHRTERYPAGTPHVRVLRQARELRAAQNPGLSGRIPGGVRRQGQLLAGNPRAGDIPEIDYNSIDRIRGLQVVVVTTARTDREGLRLLELLGMPFTRGRDAMRAA